MLFDLRLVYKLKAKRVPNDNVSINALEKISGAHIFYQSSLVVQAIYY